jgi:hypothetical protein
VHPRCTATTEFEPDLGAVIDACPTLPAPVKAGIPAVSEQAKRSACPHEGRPHAEAIAIGEGVQIGPQILRNVERGALQPVYRGDYGRPYRKDPPPRRDVLPRTLFLTTSSLSATRVCQNRCDFCYLSTSGLPIPHQRRDMAQAVADFAANGQPCGIFADNNWALTGSTCESCVARCESRPSVGMRRRSESRNTLPSKVLRRSTLLSLLSYRSARCFPPAPPRIIPET